jgi:hypothetical protein
MSLTIDQDDLPAILARAFVLAWQSYYQPGRREIISEETARPALAKHLVALAKQGVIKEIRLAAAGLIYLNSLKSEWDESVALRPNKSDISDEPSSRLQTPHSRPWHFSVDDLNARFLPQWRIPWSGLGSGVAHT